MGPQAGQKGALEGESSECKDSSITVHVHTRKQFGVPRTEHGCESVTQDEDRAKIRSLRAIALY